MNTSVRLRRVHVGAEHYDQRPVESPHEPLRLWMIRRALEFLDTQRLVEEPSKIREEIRPEVAEEAKRSRP